MAQPLSDEQIQELLGFYRKEFFLKTGKKLACFIERRKKGDKAKSYQQIMNLSANFFNIPTEELLARGKERTGIQISRDANLVETRHMTIKMLRLNKITQEFIAGMWNVNRTSIIYAQDTFKNKYKFNMEYKKKFNDFKSYCSKNIWI